MGAKKDDDEFVLQLTFTFSKLLSFEATAASLLQNTDILYYLVDLLQDKNKEVCSSICLGLDVPVLAAHDSDLTCRGGSIRECSPQLRLDLELRVMPGRGTGHLPFVFLSVVAVGALHRINGMYVLYVGLYRDYTGSNQPTGEAMVDVAR